jgi:hypothetical protein
MATESGYMTNRWQRAVLEVKVEVEVQVEVEDILWGWYPRLEGYSG